MSIFKFSCRFSVVARFRMKFLFLVLVTFHTTQCVKILGVFPSSAKSHYILGTTLMRGLAEKGNNVTVILPMGEKNPPYKQLILADAPTDGPGGGFDLFQISEMSVVGFAKFTTSFGASLTEKTLSDPGVQKLLKSDEKFDVVIMEQFLNDGLSVFAYHYKVPLVLFVTCGSNSWINPLVANPAPPSYIPEQNTIFDYRNFFDRLKNSIIFLYGQLHHHFLFSPAQNRIMKKYFPDAPDLKHLIYNSSLVLLNSDLSSSMAVPRVPSMIDIGGFHINPPKKLPQDLQKFLDGAKHGVVYFSMGSILQSSNMAPERRDSILRVFSKLKETVLWKFEDEGLAVPKNVKLAKWLPQQDILAHPNVKVFITHAGLLSLFESIYFGVPVVTIPVFGDQIWNSLEAEANGLGRCIIYSDFTEEKFAESLNDVLSNPKYRENMQRRSKIMRDRRHKPIDDADYWIRYVVRHQGATHLRVAGLHLPWYQYLCLDVAAFILSVIILIIYLLYFLVKTALKMKGNSGRAVKVKKN